MFRIDELFQPRTIAEAAELLEKYSDITVLGGCGFLKLGNRRVAKAIDLSRCDLHSIREAEQKIEIGAMVTLRDIETYPGFLRLFTGALPKATGNIMGVQFRRSATVGASVYSKYGFSDLIPVLLALKTEVELLRGGRMQLDDFLEKPLSRDILIRLFITKDERRVSYQNMRNSRTDFPIVNAAVSRVGNDWRVVVGARPARAQLALSGAKFLSETPAKQIFDVEKIAAATADEVAFGNNNKASADYRRSLCRVLVKRAIEEVLACE